jgi:hypothetical protein
MVDFFSLVEKFIDAQTTGPTETQFWGPVDATLAKALLIIDQWKASRKSRDKLSDLAVAANRVALCAYLQGFYELAWEATERQIHVLSKITYPSATICEVQPWINLARLARAMIQPQKLVDTLAQLAYASDKCALVDPSTLPLEETSELVRGDISRTAQHVRVVETAKLKWLVGDFDACVELVETLAPDSGTAIELWVRSLIELGRLDEAIHITVAFINRFGWLAAYACIAFLRGGAHEEAMRVLASIQRDYPLPMLRVACELMRAGFQTDGAKLGVRIAEVSYTSHREMPALLAMALLSASGYKVRDQLRNTALHVATTSQHYPSAILLRYIVASQENCAQELETVAQLGQYVHEQSLRGLSQSLMSSGDRMQEHAGQPVVDSLGVTKAAAERVLTAMSTYSS